jgi:transposase
MEAVYKIGALVFFLPPYSPEFNPIEIGFALVKSWIQKHAHLSFKHNPDAIARICLHYCTRMKDQDMKKTFAHCGYKYHKLVRVE